ncbi:MAG: hypothetical protein ACRDTH_00355 [Pseudonocardiaceae bacterium]
MANLWSGFGYQNAPMHVLQVFVQAIEIGYPTVLQDVPRRQLRQRDQDVAIRAVRVMSSTGSPATAGAAAVATRTAHPGSGPAWAWLSPRGTRQPKDAQQFSDHRSGIFSLFWILGQHAD